MELLRQADAAGIPVRDICFGGQLLEHTHGGSVARTPEPEIGFIEVVSAREYLASAGTWFAWHYDRWQVPPDAVEFARNAMAPRASRCAATSAVQSPRTFERHAERLVRQWRPLDARLDGP